MGFTLVSLLFVTVNENMDFYILTLFEGSSKNEMSTNFSSNKSSVCVFWNYIFACRNLKIIDNSNRWADIKIKSHFSVDL